MREKWVIFKQQKRKKALRIKTIAGGAIMKLYFSNVFSRKKVKCFNEIIEQSILISWNYGCHSLRIEKKLGVITNYCELMGKAKHLNSSC